MRPEIKYDKDRFQALLTEQYCKRAGLIPGTSSSAEDICRRFTLWLYGQRRFNSLLIKGAFGTGKTTLVEAFFWTMRALSEMGVAHNIRMRIKAVFLENSERLEDGFAEALRETNGVLVIDDLGHESPVVKVWGRDYRPAEMIIKGRSDSQLPTIITTNLSLEEIERQYSSPRLADVLSQYDTITLNGKSFRRL